MSANQFEKKSEAWSARFSEPTSELVKRYTDEFVSANGRVMISDSANHSFDNLQPAIFLPLLYQ